VGSRNEQPEKTGFAHLFEHLMFSGSLHVPEYDTVIEQAGGENNAFTNTDITNFYVTVPAANLEVALWAESDRMLSLNFIQKSLDVQRKVVVEEFKQRYLNKPYGDVWHLLRPLIYNKHPYQWPTIGKEIEHIQQATMEEVKDFFERWYAPNNAILSIAGNVNIDDAKTLVEKWFSDIPKRNVPMLNLPIEPEKESRTFLSVERNVPSSALFMAFLMPDRNHQQYHVFDLISDMLSNGKSSRLYASLVKERKIFQEISCYIAGSLDKGFLIIEGKIHDHVTLAQAESEVWTELNNFKERVTEHELQKVKNKFEAAFISSYVNVMSRAESLAFYQMLGNAEMINTEMIKYAEVCVKDIVSVFETYILPFKSIVLHYKKKLPA
jgi:predicted Zn-dependent peptidase